MQSMVERSEVPTRIVLSERWRRYRGDDDREARDQLVLAYCPLVRHVAGRVASGMPAHVDLADLVAYGLAGLIEAIERYDPARGATFETFAAVRIRGAILDALRALDWVPRAVRAEGRAVERASAGLLVRLQRLPTGTELAAELGMDLAALDASLDRIAKSFMVALDEPWLAASDGGDASAATLGDSLPDPRATDPATTSAAAELHARAAAAVTQLTGREQTILALRHHQDLSFAEIGEVFSVSESRISQIHAQSLRQLRALLG